ncbi:Peptide methionine sulfoxide reductase MsrA [Alphaproteobacteria bacterium SO-S41]|nr:Peptide methionine sulfoxide reductase MsrA [Alphaproteobacteria bacterium SO-S41]
MKSTTTFLGLIGGAVLAAGLAFSFGAGAREAAVAVPPPTQDETPAPGTTTETIVLAGGCFWGVQGVFQHVKGVTRAESGYAGGDGATDYETVSTGTTGHAESIEVTFDPNVVSLGTLLQIYFSVAHDPTQLNRQGPDSGTQYRSAIFTTSDAQAEIAKAYIAQIDGAKVFGDPVVTTVGPLNAFHAAEDYHQDYATLHPDNGYIAYADLPKIAALKAMFPQLWLDQPTLINAAGN